MEFKKIIKNLLLQKKNFILYEKESYNSQLIINYHPLEVVLLLDNF